MKRCDGFSATNATRNEAKLAYIRLNSQTPCPPPAFARRFGATSRGAACPAIARSDGGSRSTKDVVGGSFTLNIQIAFGDGCDRHSYVSAEPNFNRADRKLRIGLLKSPMTNRRQPIARFGPTLRLAVPSDQLGVQGLGFTTFRASLQGRALKRRERRAPVARSASALNTYGRSLLLLLEPKWLTGERVFSCSNQRKLLK